MLRRERDTWSERHAMPGRYLRVEPLREGCEQEPRLHHRERPADACAWACTERQIRMPGKRRSSVAVEPLRPEESRPSKLDRGGEEGVGGAAGGVAWRRRGRGGAEGTEGWFEDAGRPGRDA